jgi:hypothetical protein
MQIEGGIIKLSKDLYVLDGIINSDINVGGSINAKYVHASQIEGFCDVIVNKEIIDSTVNISGRFNIELGSIINSTIIAASGIEAGIIGSRLSDSCKLMVGINKYVKALLYNLNISLKDCDKNLVAVEEELKALEGQDTKLVKITEEKPQVQDSFQLEIEKLKEKLSQFELSKDDYLHKKTILEDKLKVPPQAQIIVNKKIFADTSINCLHSATIVKEDRSRCKIQETMINEDEGVTSFFEINIFDL